MRAMGREFEFMNIAAAIAKLLCDCFNLSNHPNTEAKMADTAVTMTKNIGMTHSSFSFVGVKKNATFENSKAGVKSETLRRLSC